MTLSRAQSGGVEVRPPEVVADEEQRLAGEAGDGVREAVAEIQHGGVAALPEPAERVHRLAPVDLAERDLWMSSSSSIRSSRPCAAAPSRAWSTMPVSASVGAPAATAGAAAIRSSSASQPGSRKAMARRADAGAPRSSASWLRGKASYGVQRVPDLYY